MSNRRVVITGMGALTPLGNSVASSWDRLVAGESGIAPISAFDATGLATRFAGEVRDFDPTAFVERKEARKLERLTQFAIAAAKQALEQARLVIDEANADDIGVIVGSGVGGVHTMTDQFRVLNERGPQRLSPFFLTMMLPNMVPGQVSIMTGARGPGFAAMSACATGAHAIGEAMEIIKRGDARAMIAGGAEAPVLPVGIGAFSNMHALSTRNDDPAHASRPFDATRDGFVLAEAAGVVILEDEEYALARGATPLAVVSGYASTHDAHHVVEPPPGGSGIVRAMRRALNKAGLQPADIGYLNAHGTSTFANDRAETAAIKTVFGDDAYRLPISSTKGATGHTLGAAGAIELIFSVLSLDHGVLPPTINYEYPDPECDLDYIPNVARYNNPYSAAMSLSMGFGGQNVALIVTHP